MIHPRTTQRRGPATIPPEEWRNASYRQFLREECRCVVCHRFGCDPAHGPTNGTSSKGPDAGCIPLCRAHHDEQTVVGWPAFEQRYRIDRKREAEAHWALFLIYQESLA